MRPITIALTLALAGCSSSCAGPSKPAVNWPRVVSCTEPAQRDLLAAVQAILVAPEDGDSTTIGDRAVTELTDMAARHGEHVVACLVDEAVRSFEHVPAAVASAPASTRSDVPAEAPARKGLRSAPAPTTGEPVQTVPDSDDTALTAAARGRDFLQRVGTHVQGEGEP
jgi:hypothetical protein